MKAVVDIAAAPLEASGGWALVPLFEPSRYSGGMNRIIGTLVVAIGALASTAEAQDERTFPLEETWGKGTLSRSRFR